MCPLTMPRILTSAKGGQLKTRTVQDKLVNMLLFNLLHAFSKTSVQTIYKKGREAPVQISNFTIHLNKQLRFDPTACLMFIRGTSAATNGVYFINENGCGCIKSGLETKKTFTKHNISVFVRFHHIKDVP